MNEAGIAIQHDNNKQYPEAIQQYNQNDLLFFYSYQMATNQIQDILKYLPPNEPRDPYVQALNNYTNRLNVLMKVCPQTASAPSVVMPPQLPQPPTNNVIQNDPGLTVQMASGVVAAVSTAYQVLLNINNL